jgi:hypothetical protein
MAVVMSYPQLFCDSVPSDDYVTFSVPNARVVRKIVNDSDMEDDLRRNVFGKALTPMIEELAFLFSLYQLEVSPINGRSEAMVRLFMPYIPTRPAPTPPKRRAPPIPPMLPPPSCALPLMQPTYTIHAPGMQPVSEHLNSSKVRPKGSNEWSRQRIRLTTIKEESVEECQI